ncbi:helix-turn-helix domain-containing protein [Yeosuana sp. MJ-SS3]|uniref:Helix-turn-helix domain-containing protein n=1 Tax=Gilvirhabdus luticola TaxID=3079858 RepID=A0ABU3UA03_9FLAO|nr:helix-turn-helix domain-containing protein [Yeosuana sp. MJ-SS3]MDU8887239.1 helix-turn-helix domain-containing protein [Yeosuana sp. MJ-SS3]
MHEQIIFNVYLSMINVAFPFLQGPLLFIYVITKTNQKSRLKPIHFLHVIPFISFFVYQIIKYNAPIHTQLNEVNNSFVGFFDNVNLFNSFFLISLPVYIIISFRRTLLDSKLGSNNTLWVRVLIIFVGVIWLSSLFSLLLPDLIDHQNQIKINSFIFLSLTGFVYLISYFGFKENILNTDIPKIVGEKYKKSKILDEDADDIWDKLEYTMQSKEPFLDPELDLSQLANQIDVTPNKLSQIINTKSDLNFYDYLNRYRVEKIKKLMLDEEFKNYSILGIAFEAGFNSKATFNRVFKKFENCTPSEYRKKNSE